MQYLVNDFETQEKNPDIFWSTNDVYNGNKLEFRNVNYGLFDNPGEDLTGNRVSWRFTDLEGADYNYDEENPLTKIYKNVYYEIR
jgi:hypothetical protein